jgi:hypothetical protein
MLIKRRHHVEAEIDNIAVLVMPRRRLAAKDRAAFQDRHVASVINQFSRTGKPGQAATDDDHPLSLHSFAPVSRDFPDSRVPAP